MPLTAHGEQSALRSHRTPDAAASTASHPASLTIRIRPSVGRDTKSSRSDLGCVGTEIFFGKSEIRLDRKSPAALICPAGTDPTPYPRCCTAVDGTADMSQA